MENPGQKVTPKLFMLSQENIAFVATEADKRDPKRYGKRGQSRAQSSVVRDALDFTKEHYSLFMAYLASRGNAAKE